MGRLTLTECQEIAKTVMAYNPQDDRAVYLRIAEGFHQAIEAAEGKSEPDEIVICAAIKIPNNNGTEDLIIRGHRHSDCIRSAIEMGCSQMSLWEQGFVTSKNRYVSRPEAYKIQIAAGIDSAEACGYRPGILFSEDLY